MCRLPHDWWPGESVWGTPYWTLEKGWGWNRTVSSPITSCKSRLVECVYTTLPPSTALTFIVCDLFLIQALLDIYLLENIEESAKHAIVSFGVLYYILPQILCCLLLDSKDYSLTQGLRLFICYWMWCTHFLIKVGHPWSLFLQRLPFPLGWWNLYKACGC